MCPLPPGGFIACVMVFAKQARYVVVDSAVQSESSLLSQRPFVRGIKDSMYSLIQLNKVHFLVTTH